MISASSARWVRDGISVFPKALTFKPIPIAAQNGQSRCVGRAAQRSLFSDRSA